MSCNARVVEVMIATPGLGTRPQEKFARQFAQTLLRDCAAAADDQRLLGHGLLVDRSTKPAEGGTPA